MSLNSKQTIKCPICGQTSDITTWNSITVKDSPDLKHDLLSGKLNMFHCPSCNHKALMPIPMLYHDEDKKIMISFTPCDNMVLEKQLFENINSTSKESGELEKYEGYNLRFISQYNTLLEKILIFDANLCDKTIEVLKLMILSNDMDKIDDRSCMFGKIVNESIEFMVYDKKEERLYTSLVPMTTYNTIHEQLLASGVKPYSFNWELVNSEYASKLLGI